MKLQEYNQLTSSRSQKKENSVANQTNVQIFCRIRRPTLLNSTVRKASQDKGLKLNGRKNSRDISNGLRTPQVSGYSPNTFKRSPSTGGITVLGSRKSSHTRLENHGSSFNSTGNSGSNTPRNHRSNSTCTLGNKE